MIARHNRVHNEQNSLGELDGEIGRNFGETRQNWADLVGKKI